MLCIMNFILRMNELTLRVMNCILWMHEGNDGYAIRHPSFIFGVPYIHLIHRVPRSPFSSRRRLCHALPNAATRVQSSHHLRRSPLLQARRALQEGFWVDYHNPAKQIKNDFLNKSGLDAPFVQRKSGKISWIGWVVLRVIITRHDHLKIGFFIVVAFGIPRIAETFRLE